MTQTQTGDRMNVDTFRYFAASAALGGFFAVIAKIAVLLVA